MHTRHESAAEVKPVICSHCGNMNAAKARFCRFCGQPLKRLSAGGQATHKRGRRRLRLSRLLLLGAGGLTALALISVGGIILRASRHIPSVGHLVAQMNENTGSLVFDSQGRLVARLSGGASKTLVPINHISPSMQKAIIAIEDHNFYHNPGFDMRSIIRAAIVDLIHRAPVEGASTITEQLAKDLYLSDQKTLVRKVQEFVLGLELAHRYSKPKILDMYLNEVYFGQGADGIKAAAHVYFSESPSQLTMAQATMLAGLPQAPSLYDPLVNYRLARQRQAQVVQAMVRYHQLSSHAARQIMDTPLKFHPDPLIHQSAQYPYPWYIDQVVSELRNQGFTMNQILNGNLKIYTALRPQVYQLAQHAVSQWMTKNFGKAQHPYPYHQAAAVVENPKNGHIWAIIGGRKHFTFLQSDLAINASRSTGSSIKPLLDYAPALAKGYTQMSVLQDVPLFKNVNHQRWWPANDNFIYRGYVDLRDALAISDNNIAVHLLYRIGVAYAVHWANQHFGLNLPKNEAAKGLGIALGVDSNALTMTDAYGAIANQGTRISPVFVTRVILHKKIVFRAHPTVHQALTPDQAFILTTMLERVLTPHPLPSIGPGSYTTGYQLGIGRPAAAKSGTNNNEADAWFLGYEPQMVVGVWEGDRLGEIAQPYTNIGNGPAYGAVAAGPIWQQIMQSVNQSLPIPKTAFPIPKGVVYVPKVSITSGLLPSRYTPANEIQGAWFVRGTEPTRVDKSFYPVKVAASNPQTLWTPGCGAYITGIFLRRESDWHPGIPLPWDHSQWAPTTACAGESSPGKVSDHHQPKKPHKKHRHPGH